MKAKRKAKAIEAVRAWGAHSLDNGGTNLAGRAFPKRGTIAHLIKCWNAAAGGCLNDAPVRVRIIRESDYRRLLKAARKP